VRLRTRMRNPKGVVIVARPAMDNALL